MTKEQIEKYQKIENEIQPLKELMGWCGGQIQNPRHFPTQDVYHKNMGVYSGHLQG